MTAQRLGQWHLHPGQLALEALQDELGVFTQVATARGLKEGIRDRVLREAVAL
jgi:hypothetical protein